MHEFRAVRARESLNLTPTKMTTPQYELWRAKFNKDTNWMRKERN